MAVFLLLLMQLLLLLVLAVVVDHHVLEVSESKLVLLAVEDVEKSLSDGTDSISSQLCSMRFSFCTEVEWFVASL